MRAGVGRTYVIDIEIRYITYVRRSTRFIIDCPPSVWVLGFLNSLLIVQLYEWSFHMITKGWIECLCRHCFIIFQSYNTSYFQTGRKRKEKKKA